MKVTLGIEYTDEEINSMIDTLNLLCNITENHEEEARTVDMIQWASDAFANLSYLLCLDPSGEKMFHNNGW